MAKLSHSANDISSAFADVSLLALIAQGDETAMASFYSQHASRVYSVALRVLGNPSSAEDILQEVFLQVWRNPAEFVETRGSLEGWLAVVTRNRAIDVLRRRKPSVLVDELPLSSPQNVASEAEQRMMLARVKQLATTLPHEQRRALDLAFFQGLTHSQIALETGAPLGTVKTRIRFAIQTLRKGLQA